MTTRDVSIEISVADSEDDRPRVEEGTQLDVAVRGGLYPTARLEDGRYAAWWFDADGPPALEDTVTTEWVAAPTRFLAAATLCELWADPSAFDRMMVDGGRAHTDSATE